MPSAATEFREEVRQILENSHAVSQQMCKLIEQGFGWGKVIGPLHKLRHRGRDRVAWIFTVTDAVYNLVRMRT